ncbi:MAG: GNAT family N-acetyltransferase [Candidatus Tritonobacter lacicola]|nr:GNAT family N-acetyltransferase [Candidatus Tritonobacter lacicola]
MEIKVYQDIAGNPVAGLYSNILESFELLYSTYEIEWLMFLEKLLDERARMISVEEDGRMAGCLAFFTREADGIRVANSLPYTQASFGGPLVRPDLAGDKRAEALSAIMDAFLDLGRRERWAAFAIKAAPPQQGYNLCGIHADHTIEREILFTDLQNRKPLSSSLKWDIKKALKNGLSVESGCDGARLAEFSGIYCEEMEKKGTWARDSRFFDLLMSDLIPAGRALFVSALDGSGGVVGGIVFCLGRGIADYAIQSTSPEGKRLQANSLLISRSMDILSERGCRLWNWLASPSEGVHRFKKKWSTSEGGMFVYWKMVDDDMFNALKDRGREWIEERFRWYYAVPYELLG